MIDMPLLPVLITRATFAIVACIIAFAIALALAVGRHDNSR